MRYIRHKFCYLVLGVALVLAVLVRFWAAPLSAGPDVAQFCAFAKVFQSHGLDFYRYTDGTLSGVNPLTLTLSPAGERGVGTFRGS